MSRFGRGPPPDTTRMISLKVDNVTYRTTAEDLAYLFEKYGEVGDIYIPKEKYSRENRGFAFVRFFERRDAEDAMDALDGRQYDGRELRVQMAKYGRPDNDRSGGGGRGRSRSRDRRQRSRSRSRRRSRSRDRSRNKSRERSRDKSRERSRKRSSRDRSDSKSRSRSRN